MSTTQCSVFISTHSQNSGTMCTEEDPASQLLTTSQLTKTTWFTGQFFIYNAPAETKQTWKELIEPDKDCEVRPQVKTLATHLQILKCKCFQRFSTFRAVEFLIHNAKSFNGSIPNSECKVCHKCHLH